MRRYLQGTLDFACGIYAVINALSLTHDIPLSDARRIFQDTHLALSANSWLWKKFLRNETDHYWLVRILLSQLCTSRPYMLDISQPFPGWPELSASLSGTAHRHSGAAAKKSFLATLGCAGSGQRLEVPSLEPEDFSIPPSCLFLPETEKPRGPASLFAARKEVETVWQSMEEWLSDSRSKAEKRTILLRFHRFLPAYEPPVVSHWTTAGSLCNGVLGLHDASAEKGSIFE